jgi:O-antigen ligase
VFVLPYQRWATSLPLVVYAIFWLFSLKLDHIKWQTIPLHTVLIPGVLFIFPLVYYTLFEFNISYGLKTAIRMSPFILFPIFLFLKKEFFSLKKWYSILAFYLLGVLSFSSILFVIQFIKYFAGLQDYFNIRTETTISNIPTIYFSLLICFALMTVMYLVKSEIKLLQNRLIQVLLLSFLSCIMLAIHSKVGFVAMILILSIGGAIQFKQYRKISAGLIVAATLTLYSVLFIFQSDKMNLSHLTNSSIEVTKRIHQWKSGIYLFQNNPMMGYGSDYRADLSNISSNNLNAHNQFLELAIEYGLFGILALLLLLIYGISQAIKSRDYFFLGFIVLVAYYACFESIFTSQTGIIFVSIFLTLFLLKTRLRIKTIDENSLSS